MLAEVATSVTPETTDFASMCEEIPGLTQKQRLALLEFAEGLVQALEGP